MSAFAAMPERLNKVHFYPNYMMDLIHIWVGQLYNKDRLRKNKKFICRMWVQGYS